MIGKRFRQKMPVLVVASMMLTTFGSISTASAAGHVAVPSDVVPPPGEVNFTRAQSTHEPVTLTFLKIADDLEAKAFQEMIPAFQASEGGKWSYVNIEFNTKPYAELFPSIETSVATGASVDIIQADGPDMKHFAWNNVIADVTDHFTPAEMAQWDKGSIAEGTYNGRFYGPPEAQSCQLLWYNKDMTDAAGLQLGTDGLTYGENGTGLPVWEKLTQDKNGDGSPEVYGFQNAGPTWYDYLNRIPARTNGLPDSNTYKGVSDDGLTFTGYFDSPESIQAYQFDQELVTKYHVRSVQPPDNALFSGFSAMTVYQDMILGTLHDQFPDFHIGAMNPPYWQTPMCQTGSWHYAISAKSQHFDEALAFIKFASSDEGAKFIWKHKNQMPANVNLFNSLEEFQTPPRSLIKTFFEQHGEPRIMTPAYTEYNALFSQFYGAVMAGGNVEDLAHQYAQMMDDAAQKYRE